MKLMPLKERVAGWPLIVGVLSDRARFGSTGALDVENWKESRFVESRWVPGFDYVFDGNTSEYALILF